MMSYIIYIHASSLIGFLIKEEFVGCMLYILGNGFMLVLSREMTLVYCFL